MMQLEQKLVGPSLSADLSTWDLSNYSSIVLYSDSKSFVKKDGTIETVFPKFVGGDTVKIYISPSNLRDTIAGYQLEGESHRDYASSGRTVDLSSNRIDLTPARPCSTNFSEVGFGGSPAKFTNLNGGLHS